MVEAKVEGRLCDDGADFPLTTTVAPPEMVSVGICATSSLILNACLR